MNRKPFAALALAWCAALVGCAAAPGSRDWPTVPAWSGEGADPAATHRSAALELRRQLVAGEDDLHNVVWFGRRLGYLGAYQAAVEAYSTGLERFPDEPRLLRHRGHRLISLRRYAEARRDLAAALVALDGVPDEVEPDGMPNAAGVPTSTLHGNVLYHLALADYLLGDFEGAAGGWQACAALPLSTPDMQVAARSWWCLALRRAGRGAAAPGVAAAVGDPELAILENHAYHRLCMLQAGTSSLDQVQAWADEHDSPAIRYGLARWQFDGRSEVSGSSTAGADLLAELAATGAPAAFGTLAAAADVSALRVASR